MKLSFWRGVSVTLNFDSVDADEFRTAMRRWATGVTIVTAQHAGVKHGMTVSSFSSISLEPPLVLISLEQSAKTTSLVEASGAFGVTILGEDQQLISERFAGRMPEIRDRFESLELTTLKTGAPLLVDGIASFDCQVVSAGDAGMQRWFLGEVVALRIGKKSTPLIYFERDYHFFDR